ncbi:MAG: hypothetical protein WBA25_05485, partial [Jannaschia sp.]
IAAAFFVDVVKQRLQLAAVIEALIDVYADDGLCCAKLVWDSHCDSSDIAERHVQACPKPLPHPELVCLQRVAA